MAVRPSLSLITARHGGFVFLTLLIAYCYVMPRWADWNQNARFDLTRALVEHHTVAIDRYVANTGDYAIVNGQIVSEKAPGLSLLAVLPYTFSRYVMHLSIASQLINHLARQQAFAATLNPGGTGLAGDKAEIALALTFATLLCVTIPTALLGMLMASLFHRFSPHVGTNTLIATGLMLATPVAAYANAFYGHALAAVLLFSAFALLAKSEGDLNRPRLLALGALFGAAILVEYPAALVIVGLGWWAVVILHRQRMLRELLWLLFGGTPFFALFIAYNHVAYGTFLPTGYSHSALWPDQYADGFFTLKFPKIGVLWELTFGDFRGLFFLAPVLLLAVPGLAVWWRSGRDREAWWATVWAVTVMVLFNASSSVWWGGFAVGPRYLLPILPFCIYPISALIPVFVRHRQLMLGTSVLIVASAIVVWMELLAGQTYPPDTFRHPLTEYAWPRLALGDVSRNVGMAIGLHGLWSLAPLPMLLFGLAAWTFWRQRRKRVISGHDIETESQYVCA